MSDDLREQSCEAVLAAIRLEYGEGWDRNNAEFGEDHPSRWPTLTHVAAVAADALVRSLLDRIEELEEVARGMGALVLTTVDAYWQAVNDLGGDSEMLRDAIANLHEFVDVEARSVLKENKEVGDGDG